MGEYDPWNQKPDIGQLHVHEAARRFVRSCERDGLAEQTIEHYRTVLRIFKSLPPGLMLRAVETKHVRACPKDHCFGRRIMSGSVARSARMRRTKSGGIPALAERSHPCGCI